MKNNNYITHEYQGSDVSGSIHNDNFLFQLIIDTYVICRFTVYQENLIIL